MADWTSLLNSLNGAALGAFGREVLYLPQSGESFAIRAVFQPTQEGQESLPGIYAVLFIRLCDLAQPPERGDEVSMGSLSYKVYDIESDDSGAAVLRLRLV